VLDPHAACHGMSSARNWNFIISGGLDRLNAAWLNAFILVIALLLALKTILVQARHHRTGLNINALSHRVWLRGLFLSLQFLCGLSRHLGRLTSNHFLKLIINIIDELTKLLVNSFELLYFFVRTL
jgi:hypothetical protein